MKDFNEELVKERIANLYKNTDFMYTLFDALVGYAIIAVDFDGNVLAFNKGAHQIYGYTPNEIIGQKTIESLFPEDFIKAGKLNEIITVLLEKGTYSCEAEKVRKNGEKFPSQILFTLTKDKSGGIVGFIEISQDLTESKQAEKALQSSRASFHSIVIKNATGIVVLSKDNKVKFINPAAEYFFGSSEEELIGQSFQYPIKIGEITELEIVHKNENIGMAEMQMLETEWDGENACLIMLRDITERKKVEKELKRKMRDLERFNKLAVGRELKMIELKKKIKKLTARLSELEKQEESN